MLLEFSISVEVERVSGKFASRDDIESLVQEHLESAVNEIDLSQVGDSDSEYEVAHSAVEAVVAKAKRRPYRPRTVTTPDFPQD